MNGPAELFFLQGDFCSLNAFYGHCRTLPIIIILSGLTSLDSSKHIQKRMCINHWAISTPITI